MTPTLPSPGSIFAEKLRIDSVLGRGSMGIVYGATDLHLGRRVALKVVSPELVGTDFRLRFAREARTAAALTSEHVVRIYEAGEEPLPYLVMEYLEGRNLDQLLAERGPLPVSDAVGWILEAADAIAEAHRAGFVHRDLKPANLFLETARVSPRIKVLDFGIVRAEGPGGTSLTATGTTMGTPVYMAPEQIDAQPVDARADVWSLGVTLYELLSGALPFEGTTTFDIGVRVLRQPPVPLAQRRPGLPIELLAIVDRCLAKAPGDRYPNAAALAAALAPFAGAGRTTAPRVVVTVAPAPLAAPRRARRPLVLATLTAALTASALAGGALWALGGESSERIVPRDAGVDAVTHAARASTAGPPVDASPPPPRFHVRADTIQGFDGLRVPGWLAQVGPGLDRCLVGPIPCAASFTVLPLAGVEPMPRMFRTRADGSTCVAETRPDPLARCLADALAAVRPPLVCEGRNDCVGVILLYTD